MLWFVLLLPLLGDFALAVVLEVQSQSSPNGRLASILESEGRFIQNMKSDLRDTNLMKPLITDSRKFHDYSQTYSQSVSSMITDLRSLVMSGEDNLFDAVKAVYGWCVTAEDLLEAYTSLFDESNSESIESQNQIIQSIFAEDITPVVANELKKLSNNLNKSSSTLSSIFTQFAADFSEQSTFFQSTLHDEFVRENNARYTPNLIKKVIAALRKISNNPDQAIVGLPTAEEAFKLAEITLSNQQVLEPVAALPLANQQQQNELFVGSANNQQKTPALTTVYSQIYVPYKNRVSFRFDQTKDFFKKFERRLDEMIRHTNEVILKLTQNDQIAKNSDASGYTVSTRLTKAQENQMKRAARTLLKQCKKFNTAPLQI